MRVCDPTNIRRQMDQLYSRYFPTDNECKSNKNCSHWWSHEGVYSNPEGGGAAAAAHGKNVSVSDVIGGNTSPGNEQSREAQQV